MDLGHHLVKMVIQCDDEGKLDALRAAVNVSVGQADADVDPVNSATHSRSSTPPFSRRRTLGQPKVSVLSNTVAHKDSPLRCTAKGAVAKRVDATERLRLRAEKLSREIDEIIHRCRTRSERHAAANNTGRRRFQASHALTELRRYRSSSVAVSETCLSEENLSSQDGDRVDAGETRELYTSQQGGRRYKRECSLPNVRGMFERFRQHHLRVAEEQSSKFPPLGNEKSDYAAHNPSDFSSRFHTARKLE